MLKIDYSGMNIAIYILNFYNVTEVKKTEIDCKQKKEESVLKYLRLTPLFISLQHPSQ